MFVLYLGLVGILVFTIGFGILGLRLRKRPSKVNAEKFSRIMHSLFFAGLVTPGLIIILYPGLLQLDEMLGLISLPIKPTFRVVGVILALPGIYLIGISNRLLRTIGNGANAFRLTKKIVQTNIYQHTRNPMSLGYYLFFLSLSLISGSTIVTLAILFGYIPVHLFFLKYFEELELELRFGETYMQYKQRVPFLIPKFSAE
jgi:protein-S-isoprenylcysteine O-methyltransferase Ste14